MNGIAAKGALAGAILLLGACSPAKRELPPAPALGAPEQWVRLGRVQVDSVSRTVLVTGFVNQVEGIVELLACGAGGKTHESVFVMECDPEDLQAALLLIGAQPGQPMKEAGAEPPTGSPLTIDVQTGAPGTGAVAGAATFLRHTDSGPLPSATPWLFTGSQVADGEFKARIEESFVATYWDPWAIINIGDPVGGSDDFLVVNKDAIPPLHTPVTFRIRCRP